MTSKIQYNHKKQNSKGVTNFERFLQLCMTTFGDDYRSWYKYANFHDVLQFAHQQIYERQDPYYQDNGLFLQYEFLRQANTASKETKQKRKCYNDTLLCALSVGLITKEFCRKNIV